MPPLRITEFAPAKVNLTLHVTGQRADGYHLLDSLVVFCGIGDTITAMTAPELGLKITGPQAHLLAADDNNLVLRAARMMHIDCGVDLLLEKRLPLASGIGGGSADAAATLRAVSRLWEIPIPNAADVLALGADVPVCLAGKPARLRGIGEDMSALGGLPEMHIVLVNPGVEVPTPKVFKSLAKKQNLPMPDALPHWPDAASLAAWLARQRNDLEGPARGYAPVIDTVLAAIAGQNGALLARMSGSGATCFGLFETNIAARRAADAIGKSQAQWWVASGPIYAN